MAFFDHHCHLSGLADGRQLLEAARAVGVARVIDVGTTVVDSRRAAAWAGERDDVWFTAGVHPHDASGGVDGLAELLEDAIAVGECGLDYHYDHSPRDTQRDVFARQIRLAHRYDLPLVIHTREAWQDTFALLDVEGWPGRTVMHCFTGGPDEAERCLANGAWLSFSGIVTFPGAGDVRQAARLVPEGRYLVETDTPYLAPVPHRGKRNRPAWVTDVARGLAEVRCDDPDQVEAAAFAATHAAYGLEPPTG